MLNIVQWSVEILRMRVIMKFFVVARVISTTTHETQSWHESKRCWICAVWLGVSSERTCCWSLDSVRSSFSPGHGCAIRSPSTMLHSNTSRSATSLTPRRRTTTLSQRRRKTTVTMSSMAFCIVCAAIKAHYCRRHESHSSMASYCAMHPTSIQSLIYMFVCTFVLCFAFCVCFSFSINFIFEMKLRHFWFKQVI